MNLQDAVPGKKVKTHPNGRELVIKRVWVRNADLIAFDEDGKEIDMGNCPISILEEVEE